MKRVSELAKRYARAAFEVAKETKTEVQFLEGLRQISDVIQNNQEFKAYFSSPLISNEEKQKTLNASIGGKTIASLSAFVSLLADKGRVESLDQIVSAFEALVDSENGVTRGTVRSSSAVSPEQQKKLEESIAKVTKKKVILSFQIDPTIIGGLSAQVGGWTFDDGINTHLLRLNEELNRRTH